MCIFSLLSAFSTCISPLGYIFVADILSIVPEFHSGHSSGFVHFAGYIRRVHFFSPKLLRKSKKMCTFAPTKGKNKKLNTIIQ